MSKFTAGTIIVLKGIGFLVCCYPYLCIGNFVSDSVSKLQLCRCQDLQKNYISHNFALPKKFSWLLAVDFANCLNLAFLTF